MSPKERIRLSRRWAESRFANRMHFYALETGGHFAALAPPTPLVEQLRSC